MKNNPVPVDRSKPILGYIIHDEAPELPVASCRPMDEDPHIMVDPRLHDLFWVIAALHEIAHVRGRTFQHGYRFACVLNDVWREAVGIEPVPAFAFGPYGRMLISRPTLFAWEMAAAGQILWEAATTLRRPPEAP